MRAIFKWGIAATCILVAGSILFNSIDIETQANSKKVVANTKTKSQSISLNQLPEQASQKQSNLLTSAFNLPSYCRQKLLFVGTGSQSVSQADEFRALFEQDTRLNSLPICIYEATWLAQDDLSCDPDWQQSGRLGCQLLPLAEKIKSIAFTHLVVFADKGKANVHNGIMFLDVDDSYDVFIHELAHFSGFIDEYPLSQSLAKRVCAGVDAPNMVFQQNADLPADQQYWQSLGLRKADIHVARTCDNHTAQAFKASNKLTFMEYHDTAYIPAHYLAAWQQQLQNTPNQPSAHINFSQLYEHVNNTSESQFWLVKYQQYLKNHPPITSRL